MDFFPLRLGIDQRQARDRELSRHEAGKTYEGWREGIAQDREAFESYPADDVLRRLIAQDSQLPPRPWVLLGEPGAGKTSLLEHWHATWIQGLRPHFGMQVPVLVRLRDVSREMLSGDPAVAA